jgi:PAS domain-containing protein
MTAVKLAEAQERARQGLLHAVLENLEEGIVACDVDGTLTLLNRAAREFQCLLDDPTSQEVAMDR